MTSPNAIGLNPELCEKLSTELNDLLANYQILYMNVRGFHWNIQGNQFFELHAKFEEIYNDLLLKVDELAERILTLGGKPDHGFSDYLKKSKIPELKNIVDGKMAIEDLLVSFQVLLLKQRQVLKNAADAEDEGTVGLISDYIAQQEKLVWMLKAYLAK